MPTVLSLPGQSVLDLVLQATGSFENAMLLAWHNNISLTDSPGNSLAVPAGCSTAPDVLRFYALQGIIPATYSVAT